MANHGSTPAAWTAVVVCLLAMCVMAAGLVLDNWPMFWVGVVVMLLSPVLAKVMQAMGSGDT